MFFNRFFGNSRFAARSYYGGYYGSNNNTNYCLFSAAGEDFILLNFGYNDARDSAELNWAHNILNTYANRRAIIGSHYILNADGSFSAQGQLLYDSLKSHTNIFLTLSGHVPGESRRLDTYNGNTIFSVMSDYQGEINGGNGWLRLFEFSPVENAIHVKTYSPWLDQWDSDPISDFSFSYSMFPSSYFHIVGKQPGCLPERMQNNSTGPASR